MVLRSAMTTRDSMWSRELIYADFLSNSIRVNSRVADKLAIQLCHSRQNNDSFGAL